MGVNDPFLFEVVDTVIGENECEYKDLREKQSYITRVIKTEEENFARTIDGGLKIFAEMLAGHKEKGESVFSGDDAFKLYDTYGFPIDLTVEMAADEGLTVDEKSFRKNMQEQKERAREARKALGDLGWADVEFGKDIPATQFVGYDNSVTDGKVLAIVAEDELREEIGEGAEAIIVLDQTTMYAEMGGQVADHGTISRDGEWEFEVTDVQKNKGGKFMHYGVVKSGVIKTGDRCTVSIDEERRSAIRRAHSATHLLDKALREVLGEHVHQAGSLVEPDRVRFDFTHFSAMTPEEIVKVSKIVNNAALEGYNVVTENLPIEEAKKRGAIALFGEKYGDIVRVVDMGNGFSVEFCGGTHLDNTAKMGSFRIMSEASVASGVRRIEAVTGKEYLRQAERLELSIHRAAEELKTTPKEIVARAHSFMTEMHDMRQGMEKLKDKLFSGEVERFLVAAKDIGGLKVITMSRSDLDTADLRKMGDFLKDKAPNVVAVMAGIDHENSKITLLCVCGKEAIKAGIKAGDIIKRVSSLCGGSGGGKPDSAMGGGKDILKLDDALASVDDYVAEKLDIIQI